MGFISGTAYWAKSLWRGIAWPAARIRDGHRFGKPLRWTLHLLVLVGVLVGLGWLNQWSGLERLLRTPFPYLRMAWLPLVFLSLYVAAWFAWWLTLLLRTRSDTSEWPDIDAAWQTAMAALEHAGIDLRSVPVYLVVGRPAGEMRSLFAAAQLPLSVPQTPRRPDGPLHVFANSEAVYVACAESTLLGRQAALLADPGLPGTVDATLDERLAPGDGVDGEQDDTPVPLTPDSLDGRPWDEPASTASATDQSLESAVAVLVDDRPEPRPQVGLPASAAPATLLEQADLVEQTTARLQYVCTLLARDRQPYCPINGLLVLLPLAAASDERTAAETAVLLERDLSTIQQTLEIRCPLITLATDLERVPGGQELLARFPQNQRARRLGVSFPLLAQCDARQTPELLDTGVAWTCRGLIPPLVYRLAQVRGGAAGVDTHFHVNARLYELLAQFRDHESRLLRLLRRAICPDGASSWIVTGCYLAATGEDAVRSQAFAGGVFPQLVQVQNHVVWTPAALQDDRRCRRLAVAGYLGITACLAAVAALIWWL